MGTATYPKAIKVFSVFHDYTDIIWALSINECHDEIQAIESLLGTNPLATTPYVTFGAAIQDLYWNKAPADHTHVHSELVNDNQGNDHPQYIMVNGYPGFSRPVSGRAGTAPANLVPLAQLQSFGYLNAIQVQNLINAALVNLMSGARGGNPIAGGSASTNWRVQGGIFSGPTNGNGQITVNFGAPYGQCLQAFVATKLPPQGVQPPWQPYNWIEAQLTLYAASGASATVQFSHDYSWQPNMWVTFSWIALGI